MALFRRTFTKTKSKAFCVWQKFSSNPQPTEKVKVGMKEKIVNYLKSNYEIYRTSAVETVQEMKESPVKTAAYMSLIGVICTMCKTNPDEDDYRNCLVEYSVDIGHVGSSIRNPHSADTLAGLMENYEGGYLHRTNLLLFSFMRMDQRSSEMDLYAPKCKYVRPHWSRFYDNIIDIGVFGRWINLNKAMVEYDVNPDEWK